MGHTGIEDAAPWPSSNPLRFPKNVWAALTFSRCRCQIGVGTRTIAARVF